MKSLNINKLTSDEKLYLYAKEAYYIGEPIMTDVEFDALEARLKFNDSFVTEIVGTVKITNNKAKFAKTKKFLKHKTFMGSLSKLQFKPNVIPFDDFKSFLNRSEKIVNIEFTPKFDGNAINLIYENGVLINQLSRGDGEEGQEYKYILHNIPKTLPNNFTGEIRGEAVIDTKLFDIKYGKKSNRTKKYANARNFVAGALAKGEKNVVNDIDFIAFHIVDGNDNINELRKLGFDTPNFIIYETSDLDETKFIDIYDKFVEYRKTSKYQLDGIVAKMPENIRPLLNGNVKYPEWGIALKFITEAVTTKIIDIDWTLGKNGQLSPIALLEPVQLLGTEVKRASVYNASWMLDNKCFIGAEISLIKSGDIIPKIIAVEKVSNEIYELPTVWNDYNTSFDGVQLNVDNFECTNEYKGLKLHNQLKALNVKNIGPAKALDIVRADITLFDMFSPNLKNKLLRSPYFTYGRNLDKIIESVDIKEVELWQVIYAMQYKNCGRTISKELAKYITNTTCDFSGLEKKVIDNFISNNKVNEVNELVNLLEQKGCKINKPKVLKNVQTFEMSLDCNTHSSKGEFKNEVESSGKFVHTTLNKKTDYLVVPDVNMSSGKITKAKKYGTKIITYKELLNLSKISE